MQHVHQVIPHNALHVHQVSVCKPQLALANCNVQQTYALAALIHLSVPVVLLAMLLLAILVFNAQMHQLVLLVAQQMSTYVLDAIMDFTYKMIHVWLVLQTVKPVIQMENVSNLKLLLDNLVLESTIELFRQSVIADVVNVPMKNPVVVSLVYKDFLFRLIKLVFLVLHHVRLVLQAILHLVFLAMQMHTLTLGPILAINVLLHQIVSHAAPQI